MSRNTISLRQTGTAFVLTAAIPRHANANATTRLYLSLTSDFEDLVQYCVFGSHSQGDFRYLPQMNPTLKEFGHVLARMRRCGAVEVSNGSRTESAAEGVVGSAICVSTAKVAFSWPASTCSTLQTGRESAHSSRLLAKKLDVDDSDSDLQSMSDCTTLLGTEDDLVDLKLACRKLIKPAGPIQRESSRISHTADKKRLAEATREADIDEVDDDDDLTGIQSWF